MILEQILDHIHNYFEKDIVEGEFTIESGSISLDFLQEGQYFKIVGSVFNDGVHVYHEPNNNVTGQTSGSQIEDTLTDEVFEGEIWAMAVPRAVIALASEIQEWANTYGDSMVSPYQSESFGGYSYTKKSSGSQESSANDSSDWRSVFRSRLNNWRKIS